MNQSHKQGKVFYTAQNYQPEESLGFLAGRFLNEITDAMDAALKLKGLNSQLFGVLHAILRGKAKNPTEVANLRYRNSAAVTYTLNVLEKKSLLVRVPDRRDRRIVELKLTKKGVDLTRACIPLVIEVQNQVLAPLSSEEYTLLSGLLHKLVDSDKSSPPLTTLEQSAAKSIQS